MSSDPNVKPRDSPFSNHTTVSPAQSLFYFTRPLRNAAPSVIDSLSYPREVPSDAEVDIRAQTQDGVQLLHGHPGARWLEVMPTLRLATGLSQGAG